ncbi:MAG: segregation/condensation protein A [Kiritimatiellae bacterium]|nr:segregation/condensation protein A [Kiritimatiellia bacterium]
MLKRDEYKVELEVFEGPLDLLLYLIKKDEVDIYNIPIERITSQYMEYLNLMRMLDLNIAGEFIVMAATLMMIKSRMLLPPEERGETEEEEEDPRWDLVRQLVAYKKFKDAAMHLQEREAAQMDVFTLGGEQVIPEAPITSLPLHDISLFDLIAAFNDVLKNAKPEIVGEILGYQFTVADKIEEITRTVSGEKEIAFLSLFRPGACRQEIICTFLALLELIRLRRVTVTQTTRFGEIIVKGVAAPESPGLVPQASPADKEN